MCCSDDPSDRGGCCSCCWCTLRKGTLIIASFSLIGGVFGVAYYGGIAFAIWALLNNVLEGTIGGTSQDDDEYWTLYKEIQDWRKELYGVMLAMAIMHGITAITAMMLLHGTRRRKAHLMQPWIYFELLMSAFYLCWGIALVALAGQWAQQIGDFVGIVTGSVGYASPTADFIKTQLISQGCGTIALVLLSLYFVYVVREHWQEVKKGSEEGGEGNQITPTVPIPTIS